MSEFLKEQIGFILATVGGLVISVLSSEKHAFSVAATRIAAGLFCSMFLADPFMAYMELNPDTYRNGIAGLFAMMGYSMTRFIANIDGNTLLEFIRAMRGGGGK